MNATIALFLAQDGIINGAIYALLGVALVLVFAVTRVIFVPQGEFVAWGALTVAALEAGAVPGTAWLLAVLGVAAALLLQWLIGANLILRGFPLWLGTAHNAGAALLLLSMVALARYLWPQEGMRA